MMLVTLLLPVMIIASLSLPPVEAITLIRDPSWKLLKSLKSLFERDQVPMSLFTPSGFEAYVDNNAAGFQCETLEDSEWSMRMRSQLHHLFSFKHPSQRSLLFYLDAASSFNAIYAALNRSQVDCSQSKHMGLFKENIHLHFAFPSQLGSSKWNEMVGENFQFQWTNILHSSQILSADGSNMRESVWLALTSLLGNVGLSGKLVQKKRDQLTVLLSPYTYFVKASNSALRQFSGKEVDMLDIAGQVLNVSLDFHLLRQMRGQWDESNDGEWQLMINELRDGNADLVTAAVPMSFSYNLISGVVGITSGEKYVVMAAPLPRPMDKIWGYLRVYDPIAFLVASSFLTIVSVVIFVLAKTEVKMSKDSDPSLDAWQEFAYVSLYCYGVYLMQSNSRMSTATSSIRICALFYVIGFYFISLTFGGGLAAQFSHPPLHEPIESMRDVVESGLTWGTRSIEMRTSSPNFDEEHQILSTFITDMVHHQPGDSVQERVLEVSQGRSIYMDWNTLLEPLVKTIFTTNDGQPEVFLAPMPDFPGPIGSFPAIHGSLGNPHFNSLHIIFGYLDASGISLELEKQGIRSLREQRSYTLLTSSQPHGGEYRAFNLDDCKGVFLSSGSMLIYAALSLFYDIYMAKKKKKMEKSRMSSVGEGN